MRTVAVLLFALFAAFDAHGADIAGQANLIDGDTIEIKGQRIRLHGIDAPESAQHCLRSSQNWPCGRKAAFALADYIANRAVRCVRRDIDRYGRVVGLCFAAGENLNAWMVRNGWALAYRRYSQDYVDEESAAEQAGAGIWIGSFVPPWDWRRGVRLGRRARTGSNSASRPGAREARDRNCGDFRTWREAQAFFERAGPQIPHRLDRDKDGIACESLR